MADFDLSAFTRFAKNFNAGEMIFSEFEIGETFYFIISGRVQLIKIIGDIEKTLDILQPSEIFGEMAVLENSPRSATAVALDSVKVLEFNKQNFDTLMIGYPQLAFRLLKMFSKRIYDQKRRFMTLILDDEQAKVADVFLMLDETQPNIDRTTMRREFKTTPEGVARWAGVNAHLVRDVLNRFASQHRVEFTQDCIIVKNISDFERLVNSKRRDRKI
ncbi:MAG: Crp/Fnr family transcriptional regulator [Treponema sp.]|jgi:CRP-like cAMP-binding protein|nr:Crp/Fnr family transcriptional regulator [Treponema sp.]